MCRRVEELDRAESGHRNRRDRRPPGIVTRKNKEENAACTSPAEDERVAQADEIRTEQGECRGIDEADVTGVDVLHLQVQRLSVEDSLRDVGVVPFVGGIPEPVVEGVDKCTEVASIAT